MDVTQRRILQCRANGVDHVTGQPVSFEMQQQAMAALHRIDREEVEDRRKAEEAERIRLAAEEDKRRADREFGESQRRALTQEHLATHELANTFEARNRELDLREAEIQVEKAKVVVRMLEVASSRPDFLLADAMNALQAIGLIPATHQLTAAPAPATPTPSPSGLDRVDAED
jgi:hypothetical protein